MELSPCARGAIRTGTSSTRNPARMATAIDSGSG